MSKLYYKTILWTAVILVLSFIRIPQGAGMEIIPHADKLVHFFLYLILGVIMLAEVENKLIVLLYVVILSAGVEIGQSLLTDYRTGDFVDFLAGLAGGVLGIYLKHIIKGIK